MSTQYKILTKTDIAENDSVKEFDSENLFSGLFLTDSQKFSFAVFALPVIMMIAFCSVAYMFEYAVSMALEMFLGVPVLFVMSAFLVVDIILIVIAFNSIKKKFM